MTSQKQNTPDGSIQTPWFLGAAALFGLVLAFAGSLMPREAGEAGLPDAVAVVNGAPITTVNYQRAVTALAADKVNVLTDDDRAFVLRRLIEEELLYQRAMEIGLPADDAQVRKVITTAMIRHILDGPKEKPITDDDLKAHYKANPERFTQPQRLAVDWIFLPSGSKTGAIAAVAKGLAAGEAFDGLKARYSKVPVAPIPAGLLPPAKLRDYVGPAALIEILQLKTGEVSKRLPISGGSIFVRMTQRVDGDLPPFDEVKDRIWAHLNHARSDEALRSYLDWLTQRAEIAYSAEAPR